jgi:hypothetical protein
LLVRRIVLALVLTAVALVLPARAAQVQEKWVYWGDSIATTEQTDNFIKFLDRAKKAGYTHIMFDDVYLQMAKFMPQSYLDNTARARKAAEDAGIVVVPNIFNVGYSWRILYYDSNLAEGIPARDMRFVVKDGKAIPDATEVPKLVNTGFEGAKGEPVAGWAPSEFAAPCVSVDTDTKHSGNSSLKMSDFGRLGEKAGGDCYVTQTVPVEPFKYYRLTVWRKTSGVKATGSSVILMSGNERRRLCYTQFESDPNADWDDYVASDSDWREFQLTFNTLESDTMTVRIGLEGAKSGTVWWDDLKVEPAGLANVLRRELVPLVVESSDKAVTFAEGKDFEAVADPKLGMTPMPTWLSALPKPGGSYDIWHEGPAITLTKDSSIKEGDVLLVSYYHPHIIYSHQVCCSLEDPKVFDILDQQMQWAKKLWDAPVYMLGYDEIRAGGWEKQPGGATLTPGQLLANHISRAYQIVMKYSPNAKVYTWSDMFDVSHNAGNRGGRPYYLVNGNWAGASDGLPKEMGIIKWGGASPASIKFFTGRGNTIIFSGEDKRAVDRYLTASKGAPGIVGFMFTNWQKNFTNLEAYSKAIDDWKDTGK